MKKTLEHFQHNLGEAPVESCSSSPEQLHMASFSSPPSNCSGEESSTLSVYSRIVNTIRPYSENTQKEALKEMINRLQKESDNG